MKIEEKVKAQKMHTTVCPSMEIKFMVSFLTSMKKARTLDIICIQKLPPDMRTQMDFTESSSAFALLKSENSFQPRSKQTRSSGTIGTEGYISCFPELSPDFPIIRWNTFRVTLALFKQVPYGFHSFQISTLPYSGTAIEPVSEKAVMQSWLLFLQQHLPIFSQGRGLADGYKWVIGK